MELKKIFNSWAGSVQKDYANKQWLLSKWELFEGIEWPDHPFCLGVQWHPEYDVTPADQKIFVAFLEAAKR